MTLEVPADQWAELVVIGCAVACEDGAALANARLVPSDFADARHRQLFTAAIALVGILRPADRIDRAAAKAGVDRDYVLEIVRRRTVYADVKGGYARRVKRAASGRRVMAGAVDLFNALGAGEDLADVLPLVEAM